MVRVKHIKKTKRYLLAGIVSLMFPLYSLDLWIYIAEMTSGPHGVLRQRFLSYFPPVLQNSLHLTVIALVCCLAAFVFGFMALPTNNKRLQTTTLALMGFSSLLGLWFLFGLM